MIEDGLVVGLGSGRTAAAFTQALGKRVQQGLCIRGVPTSEGVATLARGLGIPLVTFEQVDWIDITVDGADEVDPHLDLIKGLGGALVREKIVATASRRLVIVVGQEKLVSNLGEHGVLPVEVVPFALGPCRRRLAALGYPPLLRAKDEKPYVSDNGNFVLDCRVPILQSPAQTEETIRAIPGVVGTGLFLGIAETVLISTPHGVESRRRPHR
jgi:ribose 5-phosphate isomerase A